MTPVIFIVTGYPCSGKTSLAVRIALEFHLPLINKDGIKELLFDSLGWSDRSWSRRLGIASYALLYYFLEAQLRTGNSTIVESNFSPEAATPIFRELLEKYPYRPVQILCKAEGETLWQRFKRRAESGERHPGHVDQTTYAELEDVLRQGRIEPLDIGGALIEVDTTEFVTINYPEIIARIRATL
jgi:predicted kinase